MKPIETLPYNINQPRPHVQQTQPINLQESDSEEDNYSSVDNNKSSL